MPKREIPHLDRLTADEKKLYAALNIKEPVLSAVLIGSSYLDACLEVLLGGFLRAGKTAEKLLDPRSGAIGSFAARADLCYCLDLISKDMYQDLITIAEIRNQLAHNYFSLSFSTESVAELCGKLRYVKSLRLPNANNTAALEGVLKDARGIFVMSVVLLSRDLLIKSREVRQQDV